MLLLSQAGGGDRATHSHPRSPASSCTRAMMPGKREPGNLDDCSPGMLGSCHFSFHSFSSDALTLALPLPFVSPGSEDVKIDAYDTFPDLEHFKFNWTDIREVNIYLCYHVICLLKPLSSRH